MDVIKHSFKKFGLSNNAVESEDDLVVVKGIKGYEMMLPEKEFQLLEEEIDDDDGNFK